jgi:hypothetical protein
MSSVFGVYLNAEELAYVKSKPKGWLRRLVQHQMKLAEKNP